MKRVYSIMFADQTDTADNTVCLIACEESPRKFEYMSQETLDDAIWRVMGNEGDDRDEIVSVHNSWGVYVNDMHDYLPEYLKDDIIKNDKIVCVF